MAFHVITVGLLLTNMLIAMMANTFQAISENARTEWKFGWAQHIVAAEASASKSTLDKLYKALAAMDGVRQQEAPSLFDFSEDSGYMIRPRLTPTPSLLACCCCLSNAGSMVVPSAWQGELRPADP